MLLHVMKQDHPSNLRFLYRKIKFLNCLLLIMHSNFITKQSFLLLIHLRKDFTHIWRITVFKLFSMTCSAIYGQNVQTTIGQKLSAPFNYFTRIASANFLFSSFFAVQELNFVKNQTKINSYFVLWTELGVILLEMKNATYETYSFRAFCTQIAILSMHSSLLLWKVV